MALDDITLLACDGLIHIAALLIAKLVSKRLPGMRMFHCIGNSMTLGHNGVDRAHFNIGAVTMHLFSTCACWDKVKIKHLAEPLKGSSLADC